MPERLAPPVDRLAAAGDPKLRRVLVFARARRASFTAADVALALDVHHNVARRRLDRLAEAGFLVVTRERRGDRRGPGAGRPANVYRVAPELEGIEFPDRRLAQLVGLLVKRIPARGRSAAMRNAGEDFGRELAGAAGLKPASRVGGGLERLCDALGSLGFQVSVVSVADDRAELASPTCPLRPMLLECPATVGIDHGMWAGLVEQAVNGVSAQRVRCETPSCHERDQSCRILLALGRSSR